MKYSVSCKKQIFAELFASILSSPKSDVFSNKVLIRIYNLKSVVCRVVAVLHFLKDIYSLRRCRTWSVKVFVVCSNSLVLKSKAKEILIYIYTKLIKLNVFIIPHQYKN